MIVCITLTSVPVCPVQTIDKGQSNSSACFSSDKCPVGTTLQYSCTSGFLISSPTTKCLEDHTWSNTPACVKGDKRVNLCQYLRYIFIQLKTKQIFIKLTKNRHSLHKHYSILSRGTYF